MKYKLTTEGIKIAIKLDTLLNLMSELDIDADDLMPNIYTNLFEIWYEYDDGVFNLDDVLEELPINDSDIGILIDSDYLEKCS